MNLLQFSDDVIFLGYTLSKVTWETLKLFEALKVDLFKEQQWLILSYMKVDYEEIWKQVDIMKE